MKNVGHATRGESRTTIDRVLKGGFQVSTKAKDKVEKSLAKLGYEVNPYASTLAKSAVFNVISFLHEHKRELLLSYTIGCNFCNKDPSYCSLYSARETN